MNKQKNVHQKILSDMAKYKIRNYTFTHIILPSFYKLLINDCVNIEKQIQTLLSTEHCIS